MTPVGDVTHRLRTGAALELFVAGWGARAWYLHCAIGWQPCGDLNRGIALRSGPADCGFRSPERETSHRLL